MDVMNEKIRELSSLLSARFPGAELSIDEPDSEVGHWYVDITLQDQHITIVANKAHGFGVTARDGVAYGEGSDETYRTVRDVFDRIKRLLLSGAHTQETKSLSQLRKSRLVSQVELAKRLHIKQGSVSKLEHRDDVLVTTLKNVVSSLGGRLELRAVFDDEVVNLQFEHKSHDGRVTQAHEQ